MKKAKKRDKKYRKKIVCNPFGMRDSHMSEIPLLVAVDTMGTDSFTIGNAAFIASFSRVVKKLGAPRDVVDPVFEVASRVVKRFEDGDDLSITVEEREVIKNGIPRLLRIYRDSSNYDVVRATNAVIRDLEAEAP